MLRSRLIDIGGIKCCGEKIIDNYDELATNNLLHSLLLQLSFCLLASFSSSFASQRSSARGPKTLRENGRREICASQRFCSTFLTPSRFAAGCSTFFFSPLVQGCPNFPKTTLQYEGDDDVDAMLIFLEIRKY